MKKGSFSWNNSSEQVHHEINTVDTNVETESLEKTSRVELDKAGFELKIASLTEFALHKAGIDYNLEKFRLIKVPTAILWGPSSPLLSEEFGLIRDLTGANFSQDWREQDEIPIPNQLGETVLQIGKNVCDGFFHESSMPDRNILREISLPIKYVDIPEQPTYNWSILLADTQSLTQE